MYTIVQWKRRTHKHAKQHIHAMNRRLPSASILDFVSFVSLFLSLSLSLCATESSAEVRAIDCIELVMVLE